MLPLYDLPCEPRPLKQLDTLNGVGDGPVLPGGLLLLRFPHRFKQRLGLSAFQRLIPRQRPEAAEFVTSGDIREVNEEAVCLAGSETQTAPHALDKEPPRFCGTGHENNGCIRTVPALSEDGAIRQDLKLPRLVSPQNVVSAFRWHIPIDGLAGNAKGPECGGYV